jgi:PDZ domain-containing protein/aspartyl protease
MTYTQNDFYYKKLKPNGSDFVLLFIVLILFAGPLKSQQGIKAFYFTNPAQNKITIPFKLIHNLIVIPLFINDSDTLHFILDSGVKTTLLTELPAGDSLDLKVAKQMVITGLGNSKPSIAYHTFNNTIHLKGIEGNNQDILVLEEDKLFLSNSLGMEINGLIGYDFFRSFIVEIYYARQKIIIRKPEDLKLPRKMKRIPLEIRNKKPYVEAEIIINGKSFNKEFLLDLGASYACSVYEFLDNEIRVPEPNAKSVLGKGLNGQIHGLLARIEAIKIGGYTLESPLIAFPDSNSIDARMGKFKHIGSIGSEIMTRFSIIMNYPGNEMYIQKNQFFRKPFTFNTSGIEIITPFPGLPIYEVEYVRKGSPADLAGIKKGDVIKEINKTPVYKKDLQETIEILSNSTSKRLYIKIFRDKKLMLFKLMLKDIL